MAVLGDVAGIGHRVACADRFAWGHLLLLLSVRLTGRFGRRSVSVPEDSRDLPLCAIRQRHIRTFRGARREAV